MNLLLYLLSEICIYTNWYWYICNFTILCDDLKVIRAYWFRKDLVRKSNLFYSRIFYYGSQHRQLKFNLKCSSYLFFLFSKTEITEFLLKYLYNTKFYDGCVTRKMHYVYKSWRTVIAVVILKSTKRKQSRRVIERLLQFKWAGSELSCKVIISGMSWERGRSAVSIRPTRQNLAFVSSVLLHKGDLQLRELNWRRLMN